MDPTEKIRSVSLAVKQQYCFIIQSLGNLSDTQREERVTQFKTGAKTLSAEAKSHLQHILHREKIHYDFMQVVFAKAYREKYGKSLPGEVPKHDFSKDDMFAFVLAMKFDVFTGKSNVVEQENDADFKDMLAKLVDLELNMHYMIEPHHPEFEKLTGKECREQDIMEMAVDRLARNVQFNRGLVDMERMKKFLPKFTLGDTEKKEKIFLENVERFADLVSITSLITYFK